MVSLELNFVEIRHFPALNGIMATMCGPYEYTATGILGDKRESMLQNQLLLRVSDTRSQFKL